MAKYEKALEKAKELERHKLLSKEDLEKIQKMAERQPEIAAKIITGTKDWFILDEKELSRRRKAYK